VTGDCDDTDPAVNPDADETCNGHDDDCDGETDESGCPPADEWADVLIPQPDASPDAADGSDLPSAPDAASPDASASDPASELPAADNVAADSSATDATTPDSSSGGSGCGLSRSPSPGLPPLLAALLALALLAHARPRSR
jgi:hypothetical protein